MDSLEIDANKNADSANGSVESFEDAIEHLDDSLNTTDAKPIVKNDIKPTVLSDKSIDSSPIDKSDFEANIDTTVVKDIGKASEEKAESSEDVPGGQVNAGGDYPKPEQLIKEKTTDFKTELQNVDAVTSNQAKGNIDQTETSVPSDSKEGESPTADKITTVENTMKSLNLDKPETNKNPAVKSEVTAVSDVKTDKPEFPDVVKDLSLTSTESKDKVTKHEEVLKDDKPIEVLTKKVSELAVDKASEDTKEEVLMNGDPLHVEEEKVTKTDSEVNADQNNSNERDNSSEDDDGSIKSEREQGDGQGEQDEKKELELDEDKRNPEYIPKKGSFYEHDTRTMDGFDDDVKKLEEEIAAKTKKKPKPVSSEGRWQHDKYDELDQVPKSTQEIVDTYGYDIRNEEHPPKARRNRRYGRGPNKYSRNWEDEKAYIKIESKGPQRSLDNRGGRSFKNRLRNGNSENISYDKNPLEFPPLAGRDKLHHGEDKPVHSPRLEKLSDDKIPTSQQELHYSDKIGMKASDKIGMNAEKAWAPPPPFSQKNVVRKEQEKNRPSNTASKETQNPSMNEEITSKVSVSSQPAISKMATMPVAVYIRQQQSRPQPSVATPQHWYHQKVESTAPPDLPDLSQKDMSKLPGGISAMRGGKRYSVQRQQSLPESQRGATIQTGTNTVTPISVPQSSPSHLVFTQSPPPSNSNPAPPMMKGDYVMPNIPGEQPIYHSNSYQPATQVHTGQNHLNNGVPGAAGPQLMLPVHFVQPPPSQVSAFTPQPPTTFNAQPQTGFSNPTQANFTNQAQGSPIINYGPQPMQYQQIQPSLVNVVPPQPEVFQPAGGITYYSPQTQAVLQRPALSKRVKSAIPIVPPSEIQQGSNIQSNLVAPNNMQMGMPQQVTQVMPSQLVPIDINQEDPSLSM